MRLYRLLLQLYPKHIRDEFGDEMLAVFQAASHDCGGLWFLLRECSSLLRGAAQERQVSPLWTPELGGVAAAFGIYWALYSFFDSLLPRIGRAVQSSSIQSDSLTVAIMALPALLLIVPLVVMVCRQTQLALDKTRFERKRLHAHR